MFRACAQFVFCFFRCMHTFLIVSHNDHCLMVAKRQKNSNDHLAKNKEKEFNWAKNRAYDLHTPIHGMKSICILVRGSDGGGDAVMRNFHRTFMAYLLFCAVIERKKKQNCPRAIENKLYISQIDWVFHRFIHIGIGTESNKQSQLIVCSSMDARAFERP